MEEGNPLLHRRRFWQERIELPVIFRSSFSSAKAAVRCDLCSVLYEEMRVRSSIFRVATCAFLRHLLNLFWAPDPVLQGRFLPSSRNVNPVPL